MKNSIRQDLEENGYTLVDLLAGDEIAELVARYQRHVSDKPPEGPIFTTPQNSDSLRYIRSVCEPLKKFLQQKVDRCFEDRRVHLAHFGTKRAKDCSSTVSLHQDISLVNEPEDLSFNLWCPLASVDRANSCLYVIEGSHRLNSKPRGAFFPYVSWIPLLQKCLKPLPLKAGQAVIFDSRIFHCSFPNLGSAPRVTLNALLVPRQCSVRYHWYDPKLPERLEVFDAEDAFLMKESPGGRPKYLKSLGTIPFEFEQISLARLIEALPALREVPESYRK